MQHVSLDSEVDWQRQCVMLRRRAAAAWTQAASLPPKCGLSAQALTGTAQTMACMPPGVLALSHKTSNNVAQVFIDARCTFYADDINPLACTTMIVNRYIDSRFLLGYYFILTKYLYPRVLLCLERCVSRQRCGGLGRSGCGRGRQMQWLPCQSLPLRLRMCHCYKRIYHALCMLLSLTCRFGATA